MYYPSLQGFSKILSIIQPVVGYKSIVPYNTIFNEIADTHYHENYHSDIICYLLKDKEIRRIFLNWLSNEKSVDNTSIQIEDIAAYDNAKVIREQGHIDIAVVSADKSKAIIIENIYPNLAIDIIFSQTHMDISIAVRNGDNHAEQELREKLGVAFPFPEEKQNGRYQKTIEHNLDDKKIRSSIDNVIKPFINLLPI